jgi:hypothetical protein
VLYQYPDRDERAWAAALQQLEQLPKNEWEVCAPIAL